METRISKIYEAYTALADNRITPIGPSSYLVASSDFSKKYTVKKIEGGYSSNDNATLWQHYAGYPILAVRRIEGLLSYDREILILRKGINWKKENTKYKNDYKKSIDEVLSRFNQRTKDRIDETRNQAFESVKSLNLIAKGNREKIIKF